MSDGLEHTTKHDVLDVDSLLDRYAPTEDDFDVVLPHGEVFKFRALLGYSQLKQFERDALAWFKTLPHPSSEEAKSHPWKDHLPKSFLDGYTAYLISARSVEPKIEQLDALRMLSAPYLINNLVKALDKADRTMASIIEGKLLDAAKNESGETDGSGQS